MHNILKKLTIITSFLAISLAIVPQQAYAGFGVSPSNIVHEQLRPGGHFEKEITLSRSDPGETLDVVIEPSLDEMKNWFTFEPGMSFTFPAGETRMSFIASIDVPEGVELKHYEGVIRVKAASSEEVAGGVNIVQGARIQVDIVTTNADIVQLEAKNLQMRDVVGDETLKLDMNVTNNGTTPASPWVKLTTLNLFQDELETLEARDLEEVGANETKALTAEFTTQLGTGEYFALVEIMHGEQLIRKERLVFRVSERGEGFTTTDTAAGTTESQQANTRWLTTENLLLAGLFLVLAGVGYAAIYTRTADTFEPHRRKGFTIYLVSLLSVFSMAMWLRGAQRNIQQETTEPVAEETIEVPVVEVENEGTDEVGPDATTDTDETDEATNSGEVQGVTDRATPEPLIVRSNGQNQYPIFLEQDTASEVIYLASEDETFEVIEENSRWFRVQLPSGIDGWLSKSSVKQIETAE